jgi:multiple sugar transport system permease protein
MLVGLAGAAVNTSCRETRRSAASPPSHSRMSQGRTEVVHFGLITIRMFPHMLLAIPFFVMGSFLNLIDGFILLILALVAINQLQNLANARVRHGRSSRKPDEAAAIEGCNIFQT